MIVALWKKLTTPEKTTPALEAAFAGRPIRTDEDYVREFYSDSEIDDEIIVTVRQTFLKNLHLDLRRLQPDDSFGKELKTVWTSDSLADVEIILTLEKHFGVTLTDEEAQSTVTLRDLTELIHHKVKAKPAAQASAA